MVYECEFWNRYGPNTIYYKSIEIGKKVYEQANDDFKNFKMEIVIDHMVDYLYKYDMIKDNYSIEDVKSLKQLLLPPLTRMRAKAQLHLKYQEAWRKLIKKPCLLMPICENL